MASGAVFQLNSPSGYAAGFRLGEKYASPTYSPAEYQLHVAALADRFGLVVPEPPPDPERNLVAARDWVGTRIGILPRELQMMIREYWRHSPFPAAYRFAGIVPHWTFPGQFWRNMLPMWINQRPRDLQDVTRLMLPKFKDDPDAWFSHPQFRLGYGDLLAFMWIGDTFVWIERTGGGAVAHWGNRTIDLPQWEHRDMPIHFIDEYGTLLVADATQLICDLPDSPRIVQLPLGTHQIIPKHNMYEHNYRWAGGYIYRCRREIVEEIAVETPDLIYSNYSYDARGNLIILQDPVRRFAPAWIPFVAGAAMPTDPGTMTDYDIESGGQWTVAPDCTLYCSGVHFTRVYVPT